MSGIYLIAVISLWLLVTWLLLHFSWRVCAKENKVALKILMSCIILAWRYGGGQKYYYDGRTDVCG